MMLRATIAIVVAFATSAAAAPIDDTISRGVACFDQGDLPCAARELHVAHDHDPADADVTLLLGITEYRLGHLRVADPLLRTAARSSDAETAASARIFLGLLDSDRGDSDSASAELDLAAKAPGELGASAHALAQRRRAPAVQLLLLVQPDFDSNVRLLPMTPLAGTSGQRADGDVLVLGALAWRPWRRIGLTLDETASYRQQFTLLSYDMFASYLNPRYNYFGRNDRVGVGYTFELLTLGSSLFTLGQVVDVSYRRRLVAELGLGVGYTFRYRDYLPTGYSNFTGPSHTGLVEMSWGTPRRPLEIGLGYLVARELTVDSTFTDTAQGGRVRARVHFAKRVDLSLTSWCMHRVFDVPDPTLGPRRDTQVYGDLSLAVDLNRHLGLIVGGSVLRNYSTISDYNYLKATVHVGLAVGYAGP